MAAEHGVSGRRLPRPVSDPDAGFSLIELLVSITLIGVVMTSVTTFYVTSSRVANLQRSQQAAAQLADDALDRVRAIKGTAITTGRDRSSSDTQWASPVTGVAPYLVDMREAYDATAAYPAGATAALPTSPRSVPVNGLPYTQNWYIGTCYQPAAGGACGTTQTAGSLLFFRVVVAATWPDRRCTGGTCAYVTATLVNDVAGDPVFNPNPGAAAPTATNPGTQTTTTSTPVSLQLAATGGAPPLTWTATGLPAGLSIGSNGLVTGAPTTGGSATVTATVTDALRRTSSTTFTWTVTTPPPHLTNPGTVYSPTASTVSLQMTLTGGLGPFTWTAGAGGTDRLPKGLSIDPSTGLISGTLDPGRGDNPVTVTVVDSLGRSDSTTFRWIIT